MYRYTVRMSFNLVCHIISGNGVVACYRCNKN